MTRSLREQAPGISALECHRLGGLGEAEASVVGQQLAELMGAIRVSTTKAWLVASSKALHHILPALVLPVDRKYTLGFFFDSDQDIRAGRSALVFLDIFPFLCKVAASCSGRIARRLGSGMHTSVTKVIDNAIAGYRVRYLGKRGDAQAGDS